jgi:hypothetical protein
VVAISRQLMTPAKLSLAAVASISQASANQAATTALITSRGKESDTLRVAQTRLGIDVIRGLKAWQVDVVDNKSRDEYTVTLNGLDGRILT